MLCFRTIITMWTSQIVEAGKLKIVTIFAKVIYIYKMLLKLNV